jgi:hypothetical protein
MQRRQSSGFAGHRTYHAASGEFRGHVDLFESTKLEKAFHCVNSMCSDLHGVALLTIAGKSLGKLPRTRSLPNQFHWGGSDAQLIPVGP